MEDINKYYKVPLFEDLEINKKGELRKISNKNKYKLHKNNFYRITLKDGSRKPIVPFMLMFITFNPYNYKDIKEYFKLDGKKIKYKDGNKYNSSLNNIEIDEDKLEKSIVNTHEESIKLYWDYDKNNELELYPENYSQYSGIKVWWKCEKGHSYLKSIKSQLKSLGCKECNKFNRVSIPQQVLYIIFKKNFKDVKLEKQMGKYRIDLYIKDINLAIEYDGNAWHDNDLKISRDIEKENIIKSELKYNLIRIREEGCKDFNSLSDKVYKYKYKQSNREHDKLKEIAYDIVRLYKGKNYNVKKVELGEIEGLINKMWYNEENSLSNKRPDLEEYYSKDNVYNFEDLTIGKNVFVNWECTECGYKWSQMVSSVTNKKNICQNCYKNKLTYNRETKELNRRNKIKEKLIKLGKEGMDEDIDLYDKNKKYRKSVKPRKVNESKPSKEQLVVDLKQTPNFLDLGKKYGVSDNGVRKWCESYNVPSKSKYWVDLYKSEKGYTYSIFKEFQELYKKDKSRVEYIIKNYSKISKRQFITIRKICSEGIYNFIGIYYKLEPYVDDRFK